MNRNQKEVALDIQIVYLELEIEKMEDEIEETYDDRRKNFLIKKKAQEEQRLEDMKERFNQKPMKPTRQIKGAPKLDTRLWDIGSFKKG